MKNVIPNNANGLTISSKDFSNQSFNEYTISSCVFEKCDFSKSSFERARLWDCTFKECNLSLANLKGAQLQNIAFDSSKLAGINFAQCDASLFFSISITKSTTQYCNFSGLSMENTSFTGSKLLECKFVDTILKKADFRDTDLSLSLFLNSDLREANFVGAMQYRINPCQNKINKAHFSLPECIELIKALDIIIKD